MAKTLMDALGTAIFNRTVEAITKPSVPVNNSDASEVAREVTKAVKPIVTNATNSEPLWQSRVAIGSVGAVLGALADLASMYSTGDWDQQRVITSLVVVAGAAFALYGRIRGASLKPLGQ
jgi:hypothetical protein